MQWRTAFAPKGLFCAHKCMEIKMLHESHIQDMEEFRGKTGNWILLESQSCVIKDKLPQVVCVLCLCLYAPAQSR